MTSTRSPRSAVRSLAEGKAAEHLSQPNGLPGQILAACPFAVAAQYPTAKSSGPRPPWPHSRFVCVLEQAYLSPCSPHTSTCGRYRRCWRYYFLDESYLGYHGREREKS